MTKKGWNKKFIQNVMTYETIESSYNAGDPGSILGLAKSPGEKNSYPSILAWRMPWTEEPGRVQFMDLQSQMQHIQDDVKDFFFDFLFPFYKLFLILWSML